jgi:glyoxylase-like metal-dependent hydrolase (beta-lactamase superfamily II)
MLAEEGNMETGSYRFKVGDFECIAVSDGFHTYAPPDFPPPGTLLFANAPGKSLESIGRKHSLPSPWLDWVSPYTCLVVRTGKHLILVDTGAGSLAPTTGKLLRNLRVENIAPEDIDIVINTHGHPDHLGGNTGIDGKPAFTKARYVIARNEWDFWTSGQAEQKLTGHSKEILLNTARQNLLPVKGQLHLVEREAEIVPGISALPAPGHTPGLIALAVSSKNERLLCISDTVLHPVHMEMPDWFSVFDIVPDLVAGSRRRLLDMASAEKDLVMAFHFPFPGLGHIIRKGKSWQWQPEEIAAPA